MTIFNIHVSGSVTLTTSKSLSLIFQPESNKHITKTRNQKHTAQRREIKTKSHDEITKQTKENIKYGEITYSIRIEGKNMCRDFNLYINAGTDLV